MLRKKELPDKLISAPDSNEVFNSISHGAGALLALAGGILLVVLSAVRSKPIHLVSFAIYGTFLFLSLLSSTLLHSFLAFGRYKRILGILDHAAIYLLIAGTFIPICLVVIGGFWGIALLSAVSAAALALMLIKSFAFSRLGKAYSIISYLSLGWAGVVAGALAYGKVGLLPLAVFLLGGLLYTVGSIIFFTGKPNPFPPVFGSHEIWHSFVLAGNSVFYFSMLFFILPLG
ncbi:MAG: hemolysin III family protein [archaeon]